MKQAKLLYATEHTTCINYDNKALQRIEIRPLPAKYQWQATTMVNEIAIVLKGNVRISFGTYSSQTINEGQLCFLPSDHHFIFSSIEESELMIFRLFDKIQLCDCFTLETSLFASYQDIILPLSRKNAYFLQTNDVMDDFIAQLYKCINMGLKCRYYFDIKIRELFFILRAFYHKEELSVFFSPVMSKDESFSEFIIRNHHKYDSIEDIAGAMSYTISGFQKHFKKTFGMTPYKWMQQQKAEKLHHAISTTEKSFKELSHEFGFPSIPRFNEFVKTFLGKRPIEIRLAIQKETKKKGE
jgi:AraC-like DNA-binding protein/mannose-6-phosphate isomerase-like protein (cupin superfamily)